MVAMVMYTCNDFAIQIPTLCKYGHLSSSVKVEQLLP